LPAMTVSPILTTFKASSSVIAFSAVDLLIGKTLTIPDNVILCSRGLDETSLDLIGQFAWEKNLSTYQICSRLKSTPQKLAYKNVNKRIDKLLHSRVIKKTEPPDINNKHHAKYYTLTEYGIYRLFLNGLNSFIVNQAHSGSSSSSNALTFLENYNDSPIFEIFIYPYFNKETLFAVGSSLLLDLYDYLSTCCEIINSDILRSTNIATAWWQKIFSWEKVPGEDETPLVLYLQYMFKHKGRQKYYINKEVDNQTITVSPESSAPIILKLSDMRDKVTIISKLDGETKSLEYEVHERDGDMAVSRRIPSKETAIGIVNHAQKKIEQLIYGFLCELASSEPEESKKFSY
ncbi:MAG TPA: hypothetical protein VN922_05050, partial [Bacteroidia bacterium]|nr:hypothetical protein [Bacteroidia bacterium]